MRSLFFKSVYKRNKYKQLEIFFDTNVCVFLVSINSLSLFDKKNLYLNIKKFKLKKFRVDNKIYKMFIENLNCEQHGVSILENKGVFFLLGGNNLLNIYDFFKKNIYLLKPFILFRAFINKEAFSFLKLNLVFKKIEGFLKADLYMNYFLIVKFVYKLKILLFLCFYLLFLRRVNFFLFS